MEVFSQIKSFDEGIWLMLKYFMATAAVMTLAACGGGGGDRQAIVDACMQDGGSDKATCECLADSAKENLDGALYSKFAKAAKSGSDQADEMLNDLKPEEQSQFMTFVMQAAVKCGMS